MHAVARQFALHVGLGALVGLACGAASALFLWLLELATNLRGEHEELVFLLPVAGLGMGWVHERWGRAVHAGTGLILDTIHEGGPELPARMAPMVLLGTVSTHLFGGSAGREGTAVQMGASLADWLAHRLGVSGPLRRELLAAGIAGGFGAVFGTPVAGTVFGMEVLALGRLELRALVPALTASVVGDLTTRALGIEHTRFPVVGPLALSPLVIGKWLVFAAAIAATTVAFVELTHWLKREGERRVPRLPMRLLIGGLAIVALWQMFGTSDYLGLGVPTIVRAFEDPALPTHAFAAKLLFTAITLGAGFLGGEVTPLFFVGATLGNVLARALELPIDLGAAVGMAAVFAAASNTPLALSMMAVELVGAAVFPHVLIVGVLAYVLTGHRGIYPAQRVFARKTGGALASVSRLSDLDREPPSRPGV